ncbi:hypothetical protein [Streptomyces sp. NPDC049555]|uniref:hypothetical protein n=1 Tax=Streptomyces sp. NPDC049555 TaxID=3154930 RepID=UPI0034166AC1
MRQRMREWLRKVRSGVSASLDWIERRHLALKVIATLFAASVAPVLAAWTSK